MEKPSERTRSRARRLRARSTYTEASFWELVRDRRLDGLKFRRQAPVGDTVVDFLCLEHRLVIEADGGIHKLREIEDLERDAMLQSKGFVVLRFTNELILTEPEQVLDTVRQVCGLPLRHSTSFGIKRSR